LGASTISMQTAKNVFLWPGRDWVRKAFEAHFTVLIEIAWGKQRINKNRQLLLNRENPPGAMSP
jgi:membrane peptidoglycan carboxypeptidase